MNIHKFNVKSEVKDDSLASTARRKISSLQNEVNLENVEDIVIIITNNSSGIENIQENEVLCLICYLI